MLIEDRFRAAAIGQTRIEQIVKGLIHDPLYLVYYIVFAKEAVKLTKKHKGGTLLQEILILEDKWTARGLSGFWLDTIKDALNVPIPIRCFTLDESDLDSMDVLCAV
ncbi:unnamed protein product [marine sediment metagenome]|uniref:Uncharacterized protein n=1 Tax=marine sediment metagenome TaxID=412755 RepID=X1H0Q3_9ZZZZ